MQDNAPIKDPKQGRLFDLTPRERRALLVGTYLGATEKIETDEQLGELENLASTYGLETVQRVMAPLHFATVDLPPTLARERSKNCNKYVRKKRSTSSFLMTRSPRNSKI